VTLNVNLEDVPWEILEAVKARIMANRRKLEQEESNTRESLRPRPQYAKFGATSRSYRRPEPAAVAQHSKKELVIYWPQDPPGLGITTPGKRIVTPVYGDQTSAEFVYDTELFGPVNSLRTSQPVQWIFDVGSLGIGTGNYTLEFYGRVDDNCQVDILMGEPSDGNRASTRLVQTRRNFLTINDFQVTGSEDAIDSLSFHELSLDSNLPPIDYYHCSIQRIRGIIHVHFKGQPIERDIQDTPTLSSPNRYGPTTKLEVYAYGDISNDNSVLVGQVRLSTSALYGAGSYTPPATQFYTPPPPTP
jgi:hypothetical protein